MLDSQDYADFVARRIDKYIFWITLAGFNIGEGVMLDGCISCVEEGVDEDAPANMFFGPRSPAATLVRAGGTGLECVLPCCAW